MGGVCFSVMGSIFLQSDGVSTEVRAVHLPQPLIFHNRARPHSALGSVSFDQFERRYRLGETSEKTIAA